MLCSLLQVYLIGTLVLPIQPSEGQGPPHLRNSFLEYCSAENPGDEKICRDAEAMKEFPDKQLRVNGVFINYSPAKIYEEIVFGWGQCITRPLNSYIKLLPWAMWQKAPQIPFVAVISETIDLFTSYADQEGQIPLAGGKTHVFILNGELRSFRGDVHRRCVAPLPDFHGVNEYHFEDQTGDSFMSKYTLTNKDKIFLGKDAMKECGQYAKMDPKRDLFLRKSQPQSIPLTFEKRCKLGCGYSDISIIRARNGTGLIELDEDAGLHGVLVMYAMNETDLKFRENRVYPPTYNGMLTSMYDTEVELGEFLKNAAPPPITPDAMVPEQGIEGRSMTAGGQAAPAKAQPQPMSSQGRSMRTGGGRRIRRENKWLEELMASEDAVLPEQKRQKRLSYSSAVFMANSFKGELDGLGQDEMRCVG